MEAIAALIRKDPATIWKDKRRFPERERVKPRLVAIGLSFAVGVSLMAAKFYACHLIGSSAILPDALESIINAAASAFAMISVLVAAKPPDECHPYGHGKIEYFSAFTSGLSHIIYFRQLPHLQSGLFILLGASLINFFGEPGLFGRAGRSVVYTSAGVLAGLFLVHQTGWYWMDGAVACPVGLNILVVGGKLVRQSFLRLMDASDSDLYSCLRSNNVFLSTRLSKVVIPAKAGIQYF